MSLIDYFSEDRSSNNSPLTVEILMSSPTTISLVVGDKEGNEISKKHHVGSNGVSLDELKNRACDEKSDLVRRLRKMNYRVIDRI